jgi:ribosomal small subunit protein bTHX
MGKGDIKTKKGKRFRNSYGNSRPKNKNIVKRTPLELHEMRMWSIERLYREIGCYDRTLSIQFKQLSESYKFFGNSITGILSYTLPERKKLDGRMKNGFIKETDGFSKIRILLEKKLTPNQIKVLRTKGFLNTDIWNLDYFPSPPINKFREKGKKELPKPNFTIKIKSTFKADCILELGVMTQRISTKNNLLDTEKVRYAALIKFLSPKSYDKKLHKHYVSPHLEHEFTFQYFSLLHYSGNEDILKKDDFKKALETKRDLVINQVKAEFKEAKISELQIYTQYFNTYYTLLHIGIGFSPQILLYTKPNNVYWDFSRFLHIVLRHTRELKIQEAYEEKDNVSYDINELEELITSVLEEVRGDIETHFNKHPNKRFSKFHDHRYFFKGEYYAFHINPNGLLETFYKSTK